MIENFQSTGDAVELPGEDGKWVPRADILADASDSPVDDINQSIDEAEEIGLLTTTQHDGREYARLTQQGKELVEAATEEGD